MPGVLSVQPLGAGGSVNFGRLPISSNISLTLTVKNIGNTPVTFSTPSTQILFVQGIPGVADFSVTTAPSGTLAAGASTTMVVKFAPTAAAGTAEVSTLQVLSNANQQPTILTLNGTSVSATDSSVTVYSTYGGSATAPPVVVWGNLTAGTLYTSSTITLKNNTSASVAVNLTPLYGNGYGITNQVGANPIVAGGTMTFQLQLKPNPGMYNQDDLNAVSILTGGNSQPTLFVESTYNVPLVSFFPSGDTQQVTWLGFETANNGLVSLLQVEPNITNCEELAYFIRQYDMTDPTSVKQLGRLLLRYQRLGVATVTVTYSTLSPTGQPTVTQTRTLNVANDKLLQDQLFDGSMAGGSIVQVLLSVAADGGPFNLTIFTPYFEPRGEVIEAT